ncbi:MAG: ATP-binding protein [Candidatus Krumholzibacteria bacterium]|nr:ATP-binding protein [Candidatus Krumholzibacteria bacterium]
MKDSEHAVPELAFLFKLLPVMQELETVDKIYRLLLAIVTVGPTIGYRRAMMFTVDEQSGVIRGRLGVEEPDDTGTRDQAKPTFEDRARKVFAVYDGAEANDLTLQARSFSVPLAWHRSALVKAARTTYPVLAEREITDYAGDPFLSFFDTRSYVAIPIKINNRVVAVLSADRGIGRGRDSVEDISLLYSLSQQASTAAQNLIDLSDNKRRSRIARKLQRILNDADTREKLEEGLRLALVMVSRAVGGSGCALKDLINQKTLHIKTVREYSPDAGEDDVAISESFETILYHTAVGMETTTGDHDHPLLSHAAAKRIRRFCSVPLISGDAVAGAMAVYTESSGDSKSEGSYSPDHTGFVAMCAGIIAAKLETEQVQARLQRVESCLEDVSSNLARERERSRLAEWSMDYHSRISEGLKMLEKVLESKASYAKRMVKVSEIVAQMQQTSNLLVSGSSEEESHYELVDVFQLFRSVVQEWCPTIEGAGIEVTLRIPATGPSLLMDSAKLSLALKNILQTTASCVSTGHKMMVECSTSQDRVLLCVADNGTGLPGDAISRLFMPFDEVAGGDEKKRALSLAGQIIQKHSGDILIKSSMSWKTILILSFPKGANRDRRKSRRDRRRRRERRTAVTSP